MNTLSFDGNREGLREFADLVAALQEAGATFTIDRSGSRLLITIHGNEK